MSYVPNRFDKDGNRIKMTKADIEFGNRGKRKPTHPKNKNPKTTEQKRKEFLRNAAKRAQEVRSTTPSEKATKISRKEMMEKKRRDLLRKRAELARKRNELKRKRAELWRKRTELAKKRLEKRRQIKKLKEEQAKKRPKVQRPRTSGRKDPTVKAPGSGTRVKRPLLSRQTKSKRNPNIKGVRDIPGLASFLRSKSRRK